MKKIKSISIILVVFLCLIFLCTNVEAFNVYSLSGTRISNEEIQTIGETIVTIVSTIGSVVSVIALIIIGIKYMLGSVEEKAEYKKTMMPYFIGAICVFAASGITSIIYNAVIHLK